MLKVPAWISIIFEFSQNIAVLKHHYSSPPTAESWPNVLRPCLRSATTLFICCCCCFCFWGSCGCGGGAAAAVSAGAPAPPTAGARLRFRGSSCDGREEGHLQYLLFWWKLVKASTEAPIASWKLPWKLLPRKFFVEASAELLPQKLPRKLLPRKLPRKLSWK